ncbi:MAG: ABC transporter ATP-binding protein [bacterium]|nr:ABC transporter ATP-binding protein [bacterium]
MLKYKWRFAVLALLVISTGIAGAVQPYFYKLFVDAIPRANQKELFWILGTFIAVKVLEIILNVFKYIAGDWVALPAGRDLRLTVVKKIQDLDFAYHQSKSTGSLISAIKRGDGSFFGFFHAVNMQLSRIIVEFIVMLIFFFFIRPELALILVVTFALNIVLTKYLIAHNVQKRREFNAAEDTLSGMIVDNLINYETVKLFAKENWEIERLRNYYKVWTKSAWDFGLSFRVIDLTVGTLGNASLFVVLLLALNKVTTQQFTPGEFIVILGFLANFYPKFFDMVYEYRNVAKQQADLEIYFNILDNETVVKDPEKPVKKTKVAGEIEFKNVTFTYPSGRKGALRNLDLHIRQGQSVAFVGKSGVGKTTIVKLLMRFFDVQKGEVLVDGINVKDYTKTQLRGFMGIVPQEPVLFNDTIEFNVGYGADNVTREEMDAAVKIANLDEFINGLPDGYKTWVGERGVKLSGGQKQRLAIARMILSNPEIIIFDEATSQLDSESEKAIQEAFWKAAAGKTVIIIAHRLSTVKRVDKIVVMQKGKIVEEGSHRALLGKEEGLYKRYWSLQAEAF